MKSNIVRSNQPLPSEGMNTLSEVSTHAPAYTIRRASCGVVPRRRMSHTERNPASTQPMSVAM